MPEDEEDDREEWNDMPVDTPENLFLQEDSDAKLPNTEHNHSDEKDANPGEGSDSKWSQTGGKDPAEPSQCGGASISGLKGRRLRKKTPAAETPYAHIKPMGTKFEQLSRKRKIREILQTNREQHKRAKDASLRTLARNTGAIHNLIDKFRTGDEPYDFSRTDRIDPSHLIKEVMLEPGALYCDRCGAYNTGGNLRTLAFACEGIVNKSRKTQHRLLQCGLLPKQGQRIPKHAKKRR